MKRGYLDAGYFRRKFGVDILGEWRDLWREYTDAGYLTIDGDDIRLTRKGLLIADGLLHAFFEPEHQGCTVYVASGNNKIEARMSKSETNSKYEDPNVTNVVVSFRSFGF